MKLTSRADMPDQTQSTLTLQAQRLSALAAFGSLGQVILLASAWLLPLASEYSLIGDTISELVLGRYGFVQTVAFVISGLGVLGLAYALRQLTVGAWGSRIGALLIAIYGVGALLVAIFPTDGGDNLANLSPAGAIHALVSLVSFVCVIVGMVILAWTFSRAARWRSLTPGAALLATGGVSLLLGQILDPQGPWMGLLQRLLVTLIAVWLILVAIRVRTIVHALEGER